MIFRERKGRVENERQGKKERKVGVASHTRPDQGSNPQPFSVWGDAQPTEPPGQGEIHIFLVKIF